MFREITTVVFAAFWVLLPQMTSVAQQPSRADDKVTWKYTLDKPAQDWNQLAFDDAKWQIGESGFGTEGTPAAHIGTLWNSSDIWLRRQVEMAEVPKHPVLHVHHDDDARIYLNGQRIAELRGYTTSYQYVALDKQALSAFRTGKNLLAVHCHQTGGGQYFDVEVMDAERMPVMRPHQSPLMTKWGTEVNAANAWREYPRPHLTRTAWRNLNGEWDYSVTFEENAAPTQWSGKILVPFCLESKLSGVGRLLQPMEALWYQREVDIQPKPSQRILLHFEAVDYKCEAWLNGMRLGEHIGGNLPFTFDVTNAAKAGTNTLLVKVLDATGGGQLRGKQTLTPSGIWYTRVSGIWQTVWLEQVPACYIERINLYTDVKSGSVEVKPVVAGDAVRDVMVSVEVSDHGRSIASASGGDSVKVTIPNPVLWSPARPQLYDLKIRLLDNSGSIIDEVGSYVGLREIGKRRDAHGNWRFTLNGDGIFPLGPLDQGWWPDGLLTPPSDAAIEFELEFLKSAGFNMLRKHIKVEPRRYYYHCDRLGMLVWQDQVSGGEGPAWTRMAPDPLDAKWLDTDHEQYMAELRQMMDLLQPVTSVVVWIPFNEAWGQHRTTEVGEWVRAYDRTRLVNIASGGNFWPVGDVADHHEYPHPAFPLADSRFADYVKVVGEFGGHGWPVKDHLWEESAGIWGYGGLPNSLAELKSRYQTSCEKLVELKAQGIAAGVYTQTTDVEKEINGLMTYDRKVIKIPADELRELHRPLVGENAAAKN